MININEQINQNLTSGNKASYGASPIGNGSSKIKFTADTYGVVMGVKFFLCFFCTKTLHHKAGCTTRKKKLAVQG